MATLLLSSGKCAWGKCIFCGWGRLESKIDFKRVTGYVDHQLKQFKGEDLKIFASGSFLDDKQFPSKLRKHIVETCKKNKIKDLTIESRPEFITWDRLKEFSDLNLTVAIGLEVASDRMLKKLNKGITLEAFEHAVEVLKQRNVNLRVYLLVNPPFVDDPKKSLDKSVKYTKKFTKDIVLINTFPHAKAPLFNMWIKGEWKPMDKKDFDRITKNYPYEKDFSNYRFIPKFPRDKKEFIKGAGVKQLHHPHYKVWQDYLQRFYEIPKGKEFVLFLPCAKKKPYSKSKTHKAILRVIATQAIKNRLHQIMISSPGIIPREYEGLYPFRNYDWPEWEETPELKERYIKTTKERILNYLKNHKYKKIFCYMKYDAESYKALKQACSELKLKLINCLNRETYNKIKKESEKQILIHPDALKDFRNCLTST